MAQTYANNDNVLSNSIAPGIYGHQDIKRALKRFQKI